MRVTFFLKRGGKILLLLFGILAIFFHFIVGEVETGVDIPNSPPYLIMDIPNQSWSENESNLNAFDLDDYFGDAEGTPLTYYNSTVQSINIDIDPITHEVSFIPKSGFSGERTVIFYASDSIYDTLSNTVFLFVGLDTSPPQWFSPSKDKTTIYQNTVVTFYTNWTDDRALDNYIFSINQGAGWVNYTSVSFSGTTNISSYSLQIMAPALSTVYWRFYASDTSGNTNVTDIQTFLVSSQEIPSEPSGAEPRSEYQQRPSGTINPLKLRKPEDFELSESDFKISLKQGSFKTRILKITNTGLNEISLSVSSQKISGFVVFNEENFSLLPGTSKEITIDFSAPEKAIPGQYFGYISVKSPNINKSLPTVLDIQAINLEFDIKLNLSEGYELVKPGKNVKFGINMFNTKDLKDVNATMYYTIKDYTGKIYNFSEENVKFFSNLFVERELQVPEIAPEGKYLIYARVSDENNIAIDSISFEVGSRFNFFSIFKVSFLLVLIILSFIFLAIFMVRYKRDKKKERLLELYIMLNRLKKLIKENKEEEALKLFIKIKNIYHEPVPKEVFDDKEKLKKGISELDDNFTKNSKNLIKNEKMPAPVPAKAPLKKDQQVKEKESGAEKTKAPAPITNKPPAPTPNKSPASSANKSTTPTQNKPPTSTTKEKTPTPAPNKPAQEDKDKKTLKENLPEEKKENDKK